MTDYRLTPEDSLVIETQERSRNWSFDTEERIVRRIADTVSHVESTMRVHADRVKDFYLQGFEAVTDGNFRVKEPRGSWDASLADVFDAVRLDVTRRLEADEAEDDDETPSHVYEERHVVRRWAAVSPFVAYRFYQYVMDAATESLREDLVSMAADNDRGESVACAAREASAKWVKAWLRGKVL